MENFGQCFRSFARHLTALSCTAIQICTQRILTACITHTQKKMNGGVYNGT